MFYVQELGFIRLTVDKITMYVDQERYSWFLLDQQTRCDACLSPELKKIPLLVRCLPSRGRTILVNRLPCLILPTSAFRLPPSRRCLATMLTFSFAFNPSSSPASGLEGLCCSLELLGQPLCLQWQDLPSGVRPPWHKVWGRVCCQCFLAKRLVSNLFDYHVCANCRKCLWVTRGGLGGRHCHVMPIFPLR